MDTQNSTQPKPRNGYPTTSEYFGLVSVADLHCAMTTLINFTKEAIYNRNTAKHREIRHQANVLDTFAKTLAANAESIEMQFDSLICK